jgi:hypothetical protein
MKRVEVDSVLLVMGQVNEAAGKLQFEIDGNHTMQFLSLDEFTLAQSLAGSKPSKASFLYTRKHVLYEHTRSITISHVRLSSSIEHQKSVIPGIHNSHTPKRIPLTYFYVCY